MSKRPWIAESNRRRAMPIEQRFWPKVDKRGPVPIARPDLGECWMWTACKNRDGYGQILVNRSSRGAHIISYELLVGQVPDGLELDHLCRNRSCVNPDHLEPVSHKQNTQRGLVGRHSSPRPRPRRTHCIHGHQLSGDNLYVWRDSRHCKTCRKETDARARQRARAA